MSLPDNLADNLADQRIDDSPAAPGARRDIRDLLLDELEGAVAAAGERPYRARQIAHWLWQKGVDSFDAMRDLPAALRIELAESFTLAPAAVSAVRRSSDGTRKLLLRLGDGEEIETVIIPADDRVTLCLSSQAGCAMGCEFCATARMGLHRNLTTAEIAGQIFAARRELNCGEHLTNYVFMGMGEPLANYPRLIRTLTAMTAAWGMAISPRRITVSTVGLVPMMEKLLAEIPVNLAVSLHATTDEVRDRLAPINQRYPLKQLLDACRLLPLKARSRITFEYVMLAGVNDSVDDARRLVKLLAPLRAKVNLIFFNPFSGSTLERSTRGAVEAFQAILHRGNLTATIRESRGLDIAAACGQLYAEHHLDQDAGAPGGDAAANRPENQD
ncbi:MAG TPA: 23S rRNA (adenine(2503)-C(2))-methyltransferase RlmN [Candidatus Binataceae bacterium]|nr:23S rRNA (adenine(2503)-C(2))-methyltransferase RlmN [Candidatus Binataceae bacterium]